MLEGFDVERAVCRSQNGSRLTEARLQAVSSRNMYSEHGFDARIAPAGRAGVPVVHGGVEVQARIGRGPGGVADLLPQVAGLQRLHHLAVLAGGEVPVGIALDGAQEVVGERDGVVGVLAGDGEVGFRVPIGVVDRGSRSRCSPAWRTG